MKIQVFNINDMMITEKISHYTYRPKSARDRMLFMQADLVVVIINQKHGEVIKDRATGENRKINSEDYPEYFI